MYQEANDRLNLQLKLGSTLCNLYNDDYDLFIKTCSFNDDTPCAVVGKALLSGGYMDPDLIKVKAEVRVAGKRPRLVIMKSVLDTTLLRLSLHDLQNRNANLSSPDDNFPIFVGADISTQSRTHEYWKDFSKHQPLWTSDIQGNEYAITPYFMFIDLVRCCWQLELFDLESHEFKRCNQTYLLMAQFFVAIFRVLQTETGELFSSKPGKQSSGRFNTFEQNSVIRDFLSFLCREDMKNDCGTFPRARLLPIPYSKSAGDDNMSKTKPDVDVMRSYGFVTTDVAQQMEKFNYCSTTFEEEFSFQDNIAKFFANAMFADPKTWDESQASFNLCFKFHPEFAHYQQLFAAEAEAREALGFLDYDSGDETGEDDY